jgi:hypothetical protein
MREIGEIATVFEGVKVGFRHVKDGIVLQLAIQPDDLPQDIVKDKLGTRYQVALVRIDADENPIGSADQEDGMRAVRLAGTLCTDENFQSWMAFSNYADEISEEATTEALRNLLGVKSRRELKTNKHARLKLYNLRDVFIEEMRRKS